jgi:hypothetical protein
LVCAPLGDALSFYRRPDERSNPMTRLNSLRWIAAWTLAMALAPIAIFPSAASAQDADTLSISGTFYMDELRQFEGTVGDDLAEVFARDNVHWWSLTLHGVTYSHDYVYYEWYDEVGNLVYFDEQYITRVHATSFDFRFFGFDAEILNQVVSSHLARGDLSGGAFLELQNGYYYDPYSDYGDWGGGGPYATWRFGLAPLDRAAGVSFSALAGYYPLFSTDGDGYPVVEPLRVFSDSFYIADYRPGNSGALVSHYSAMEIGSAGPFPPKVKIEDASVVEGNRGTTRLNLTLTLSWTSDEAVTVDYRTENGTALAKQDYAATSGTLTFQPGETSRTIAVSIKGDRKREADETFTVRLSNAVGATIRYWFATATIVNDD